VSAPASDIEMANSGMLKVQIIRIAGIPARGAC
jgi:hypothetical protein